MFSGKSVACSVFVVSLAGCGGKQPTADTNLAPSAAPAPQDATATATAAPSAAPPSDAGTSKVKVSIPPTKEGRKLIAEVYPHCRVGDNMRAFDCMDVAAKHVAAGGADEVSKGLTIFTWLCVDSYTSPACYGAMRVFTDGVAEWDGDVFFPLALGGCAFGAEDTCVENGDRFRDGQGVAKSPDRAAQLYKKGCDEMQHEPSCERAK